MNDIVITKMNQMKFYGMVRAYKTTHEDGRMYKMTADEMISFLVESEWDDRNNRRIERNVRNARFRYDACIEKLDFTINRSMDKNQLLRFAGSR